MDGTIRQQMIAMLEEGKASVRDLSTRLGIPEREVYGHLDHIRRSLASSGRRLVVEPSVCRSCGFVFSKRERLKKPGRCPRCHGSFIAEPLFVIE